MSKILIAPTLPVVNHYTIEWAHFLPRMLRNAGFDVIDAGEKIVLFPHRCSPEKGADFLAANSIDYRIGGHTLVKLDPTDKLTYHKALSLCDVVLSCALQETLGITMYEAALHGVAVVVPNRLSYVEMYPEHVRYDTAEQMHAAVASAQRLTCDELDHLHTFFRSKRLFALLDTLS